MFVVLYTVYSMLQALKLFLGSNVQLSGLIFTLLLL